MKSYFNRLTADGKYPVQDCENFQLPIQMQLSKIRKTFSELFVPFLESTSNFLNILKKRVILIGNVFPKLQTVKVLLINGYQSINSAVSERALTLNM